MRRVVACQLTRTSGSTSNSKRPDIGVWSCHTLTAAAVQEGEAGTRGAQPLGHELEVDAVHGSIVPQPRLGHIADAARI
jgi:hypothetical protein